MEIEIIQHDPALWRVGKMHLDQIFHRRREILFGTPFGDLDVAPAERGFQKQEEVTSPFSLLLVVHSFLLSRLRWQWFAHMIKHLVGTFIEADAWSISISRFGIPIQYLFQAPDELRAYRRNAPVLLLSRFKHIF
jgi:hypothetical protein